MIWYEDGYDVIETGEPDASCQAARAAYEYGVKIGGKGRLMTCAQASELLANNKFSSKLYRSSDYWLCTAREMGAMHWVNSVGQFIDYIGMDTLCVRPVVEISKNLVS